MVVLIVVLVVVVVVLLLVPVVEGDARLDVREELEVLGSETAS